MTRVETGDGYVKIFGCRCDKGAEDGGKVLRKLLIAVGFGSGSIHHQFFPSHAVKQSQRAYIPLNKIVVYMTDE